MRACVRACVCVYALACVCVFNLHIKAQGSLNSIGVHDDSIMFYHNVVGVVNAVLFYLVIISDATNKFLHGDNKDFLNLMSQG